MADAPAPAAGRVDTLMIDNYDSFTYNLVQYLEELGASVTTVRNDAITVDGVAALAPRRIIVSPGPGAPRDAGVSMAVIRAFAGKVPIFGVCLGLQCIYEVFGGTVTHAGEGKAAGSGLEETLGRARPPAATLNPLTPAPSPLQPQARSCTARRVTCSTTARACLPACRLPSAPSGTTP
jgi:hypothetical protein